MFKVRHYLLLATVVSLITIVTLIVKFSNNTRSERATISYTPIMERIKLRDELRVGTLHSLLPYYIDHNSDNNTQSGFDYELARLFAEHLGVQLKVIQCHNLTNLFDALENNEVDIIADGLLYLPERIERFRASPPYYTVSQQLVYKKGTIRPDSLEDLEGKLEVPALSAQVSLLDKLKNSSFNELVWSESNYMTSEDLLKQVALNRLDYTISDSVTIATIQRIYPQLAVAFDLTEQQPVNWYLNRTKDQSLYDEVNNFFKQATDDGTIARLQEKYLGYIEDFDYVDTRSFLYAIEKHLPKYRDLFEKYANVQGMDWQMLAAISYQESHWNPRAISPTGVRGLMMLTQNTAKSLGVNNRLDPEQSIRGGAIYISQLINRIPESIPDEERIWFALAAYNMGFAHMLDARYLTELQGDNPNSWLDVKKRLPMLSEEKHYSQTRYGYARGYQAYNFVENIRRYRVSLAGYLYEKEVRDEDLAKRRELIEQQIIEEESVEEEQLIEINLSEHLSPNVQTVSYQQ